MICGECTERLPPTAFYASNQARCKGCVKAAAAARRKADPEAHREATRRWREREQQRSDLLEFVLRVLAARYPRSFLEAVHDAEDTLGMGAGTALDLFSRTNHVSSDMGERTTSEKDDDADAA